MLQNESLSREAESISEMRIFIERLKTQGIISDATYDKALKSYDKRIIQDMVRLSVEIEVIFWPIAGGLIYLTSTDEARRLFGNFSLEMIVFSILATTTRGTVSYFRGRAHKLENSSIFALLEIIPKVGRFAPLLWLPEHEDYLSIVYAKKRIQKNSSDTINANEFTQFQDQFRKILAKLKHIKNFLIDIQDRVKHIL